MKYFFFPKIDILYCPLKIFNLFFKAIENPVLIVSNCPAPSGRLLHITGAADNPTQSSNILKSPGGPQKKDSRFAERPKPHQWFLLKVYKLVREAILHFDMYCKPMQTVNVYDKSFSIQNRAWQILRWDLQRASFLF